jgi:pimeloyl-ACP methyl ester carboxylesterase
MPFAEVNGATIHYHTTGRGVPIVFIHPPLLTTQTFNYQKAQLSDEFQVITFDIRGHGESKPSDSPITYPLIIEDIRRLLDFLNVDKAYLCGYSTGGSMVMEGLLTYPERFIGGIVVSGMPEVKDIFNKSRIWLAAQLTGTTVLRKMLTASVSAGNADMRLTFNNLYGSAIKGDPDNQCEYFRYSQSYNCTRRLSEVKQPVLLIYGQKDTPFHQYAHLFHDKLPNSSLYFIKDAKHQMVNKNAWKMNDLIRLWVESLQDSEKERVELDLEIARKLNPDMYGHNEDGRPILTQ